MDFYNPQTWNHYSYVGNNPLSNTDPNGLWLTPTHHSIIDRGLPGLSNEQRKILKNASDRVDDDQSQEGSYKYGLESEDNDPMSAAGAYNPTYQTNDWIEQNEHDAKEIQAEWIASGHTGIAPAALAAFGNAAHTITEAGRLFGGGLAASGASIGSRSAPTKNHAASHREEGDTSPLGRLL